MDMKYIILLAASGYWTYVLMKIIHQWNEYSWDKLFIRVAIYFFWLLTFILIVLVKEL